MEDSLLLGFRAQASQGFAQKTGGCWEDDVDGLALAPGTSGV